MRPGLNFETGDATQVLPAPWVTLLCHSVNNRAVWGAGFVLALSARWPESRQAYLRWARSKEPGELLGETLFVKVEPHLVIANICAQDGIGRGSLVPSALQRGLGHVGVLAERLSGPPRKKPVVVQMPRIGCGLAGSTWEVVGPIVELVLGAHTVRVLEGSKR